VSRSASLIAWEFSNSFHSLSLGDETVKEYRLGANGNPKVEVTKINWKPNKNFLATATSKDSRNRRATESFFSWFLKTKNVTMNEIADVSFGIIFNILILTFLELYLTYKKILV
jgi:hypothetical protein